MGIQNDETIKTILFYTKTTVNSLKKDIPMETSLIQGHFHMSWEVSRRKSSIRRTTVRRVSQQKGNFLLSWWAIFSTNYSVSSLRWTLESGQRFFPNFSVFLQNSIKLNIYKADISIKRILLYGLNGVRFREIPLYLVRWTNQILEVNSTLGDPVLTLIV